MLFNFIIMLAMLLAWCATVSGLQCLDASHHKVSWYAMLKAPKLSSSSDPSAQSGTGYAYGDATTSFAWTGDQLSTATGPLAHSLLQIYSSVGNNSVGYLLYDDESPDDKSHESFGHTKGVIAFDRTSAFWLVHSVPRFPPPPSSSSYDFPEDEIIYGQSFLCMSLSLTQLNQAASLLLLNKPYVFESQMSSSFDSLLPNVRAVLNEQWTSGGTYSSSKFSSLNGPSFLGFGKTGDWGQDLYEGAVASTLGVDLSVETWMNGADSNKLPTWCTPTYSYDILTIRSMGFNSDVAWDETQDHAKWAVSNTGTWLCIGDINRQKSQSSRGGGTVCMQNSAMHSAFSKLITKVDSC